MSEADQDAVIGRTLREMRDAKKELAALHAEAERLGNYLTAMGHALRTNHSLWAGAFGGNTGRLDIKDYPTGDSLMELSRRIDTVGGEKQRLEKLLVEAGYPLPKE